MKYALSAAAALLLAACAAATNSYSVGAYNSSGRLLNQKVEIDSNQAGIRVAAGALCKVHPGAQIRVHSNITGAELKEYRRRCR